MSSITSTKDIKLTIDESVGTEANNTINIPRELLVGGETSSLRTISSGEPALVDPKRSVTIGSDVPDQLVSAKDLSREELEAHLDETIKTLPTAFANNVIGYVTAKRTYSRRIDEADPNSRVETWGEVIKRVVSASVWQLGVDFTLAECKELCTLLYTHKCSVAGRFLWQLGTGTVDKKGILSLQNCAAINVDHPIEPFIWTLDLLMLGAGVGYNITPEYVYSLPIVKDATITRSDVKDADFIVPDSREGWVKLMGKVLKAHFYSGKSFTYSMQLLRSKGALIKTFGGVASGPDVLEEGINEISGILKKRVGQKIRPIDALDIMNILGKIVVSGNVRRSAQIAVGDVKDLDYLRAKRWDLGDIPNYRCYSNNSVVCNDINDLPEEFWEGYKGNGEPYGLININLMRKCGRLGDTQYTDPNVSCVNPCITADTIIKIFENGKVTERKVSELIGKKFGAMVDGFPYNSTDAGFFHTGKKCVYKIKLYSGNTLKATRNHLIMTDNGWLEMDQIEVGTYIRLHDHSGQNHSQKLTKQVKYSQVISKEEVDEWVDVYDCTIPDIHAFDANGIYVHNCAEQTLESGETCCLAEIFLPNIESEAELKKCTRYLYRICKQSLSLPCHQKTTEKIVHKNMRMGIGVTGYLMTTEEQKSWLSPTYEDIRDFDVKYSEKHGFPKSIKICTVKPSGTLSLLGGVTPGGHPGYARHYIRRIRFASNHPLVNELKAAGYHCEFVKNFDGTDKHDTVVIEFPWKLPDHAVLAKDCSAIDQLEFVKKLQTDWSDNSVSVTVYYKKEELPAIKEWLLANYNDSVKTVSFLLHSEHGFAQAPMEEINEEKYKEIYSRIKYNIQEKLSHADNIGTTKEDEEFLADNACAGGHCPLR